MAEGGGYDPSDARMPSESDTRLPVRTDDAILPVTIKQIWDANPIPGQATTIDGIPRKVVSIVGLISSVEEVNISISYEIDDGTGKFRVLDYTHTDDTSLEPTLEKGTYVYICGRLASGSKDGSLPANISAFTVKKIEDYNQIPYHMLQALYCHLYFQNKGLPANSAYLLAPNQNTTDAHNGNAHNNNNNNNNNNSYSTNIQSVSRDEMVKKAVLDFLKTKDQFGAHQDQIAAALQSTFTVDEVLTAITALNYNGEIYNASEADHYAVC